MPPAARTITRRDVVLLAVSMALAIAALGASDRVRDPLTAWLRRTILAPLVSLQHGAELTRLAWKARGARTLAADSIAMRSLAIPALESENARLRRMLGLGERLRWGFVPAEVLQGRGVGEDYTVTLSVGGTAGVRPFSPVVAAEGLVGVVKNVDPTFSTAVLWAHSDFRASAMAADGSVFGIVAAHLGGDPERYLLEMRGVPMRSTIAPGTLIVTSGLGGTFPRGIPVGIVLAEVRTNELWARTYLLRPAVSPTEISGVMVLTSERTKAGVEPVWKGAHGDSSVHDSTPPLPDSVQLRVVAESTQAADSARRRRRFRRDSIRAAAAAESTATARDSARPAPRADSVPPRLP